jgi:hypothetical protein
VARDAFRPAWLREQCAVIWRRMAATAQQVWRTAAPTASSGLGVVKDTSKETFERLRAMPWQTLARRHWKLLLVVGAVIMVGIIWKVPQWQAAGWQGQMEPKDLAKLQNDARTVIVQALGGAFLLVGLYLTFRNLQLTQDRQITEHYTRAIEQLGSDQLQVRLGAIYALERIARDSERDHWPIMEILTAYVRVHARWKEPPEDRAEEEGPPIDIQAILTVLERRIWTRETQEQRLNLSGVDLRGALLRHMHLEGASLMNSHLEHSTLVDIHLENANLRRSHLENAQLSEVYLQSANLATAYLKEALVGAVDLRGANLLNVVGLTESQLDIAHTDWLTTLPVSITSRRARSRTPPDPRG